MITRTKQLENGYYTRKLQTYDNNSYRKYKLNASEYYHPTGGTMNDEFWLKDRDSDPDAPCYCPCEMKDGHVVSITTGMNLIGDPPGTCIGEFWYGDDAVYVHLYDTASPTPQEDESPT